MEKDLRLDNYIIKEKVGEGGFGTVWKAIEVDTDSTIAIKFLNETYSKNNKVVKKFLEGVERISSLDHLNIVKVFDIGSVDKIPYFVMEYVNGLNLQKLVQKEGALSFERSIDVITQLLDALDYTHKKGIIHMDIWPPNILFTEDGIPKLTDFDLARAKQETEEFKDFTQNMSQGGFILEGSGGGNLERIRSVSSFGAILGLYASPEVENPKLFGPIDYRADIFSLGKVVCYMLTGTRMYGVELPHQMFPDKIPEYVDDILRKAITFKKELRFSSAKEFLGALKKGPSYIKKEKLNPEFESKYKNLTNLLKKEEYNYEVTPIENVSSTKEKNREMITYVTDKNLAGNTEVMKRLSGIEQTIKKKKDKDFKTISDFHAFALKIKEDKALFEKHRSELKDILEKLGYYEKVCKAWGPPFA